MEKTISELANILEDLQTLTTIEDATKSLVVPKHAALAAFLKWNYGGSLHGMEDENWISDARSILQILE